jgi:hypothetical protein
LCLWWWKCECGGGNEEENNEWWWKWRHFVSGRIVLVWWKFKEDKVVDVSEWVGASVWEWEWEQWGGVLLCMC